MITAVILTKDEEATLARAIESLGFCDRIFVVDSGSTDGTERVATSRGAVFVTHRQNGPFRISDQRNWALDSLPITTPWVLFLDADEVVPAALVEVLRDLSSNDTAHAAFELTPRYLFWGRWLKRTQGYPNWHPRLVRRGHARYSGGVWEHFETTGEVGRVHEPYDHHANAKGLHDWLARHERYARWDAERIVAFRDADDPGALGTSRKRKLRLLAARFWPLRPLARFIHMYVLRLGFLEGLPALNFCLLYAFYELMTVNLVVELRRRRAGLPL